MVVRVVTFVLCKLNKLNKNIIFQSHMKFISKISNKIASMKDMQLINDIKFPDNFDITSKNRADLIWKFVMKPEDVPSITTPQGNKYNPIHRMLPHKMLFEKQSAAAMKIIEKADIFEKYGYVLDTEESILRVFILFDHLYRTSSGSPHSRLRYDNIMQGFLNEVNDSDFIPDRSIINELVNLSSNNILEKFRSYSLFNQTLFDSKFSSGGTGKVFLDLEEVYYPLLYALLILRTDQNLETSYYDLIDQIFGDMDLKREYDKKLKVPLELKTIERILSKETIVVVSDGVKIQFNRNILGILSHFNPELIKSLIRSDRKKTADLLDDFYKIKFDVYKNKNELISIFKLIGNENPEHKAFEEFSFNKDNWFSRLFEFSDKPLSIEYIDGVEFDKFSTGEISLETIINLISQFQSLQRLSKLTVSIPSNISIPESLSNFKNISSLTIIIMNTDLSEVFDFQDVIGKLTNLKELNIHFRGEGGTEITISFSNNFEQLSYLEQFIIHAELSRTTITLVDIPSTLGQCESLQLIHFPSLNLREIPPELGDLGLLSELNLSNNEIRIIPTSFGNLTNLKMLNLEGNKIVDLPIELNNCTNLEEINLSRNNLKGLPAILDKMGKLKTLNLDHNQINFLPIDNIVNDSLDLISLVDNNLEAIPQWLFKIPHINLIDNPLPEGLSLRYSTYDSETRNSQPFIMLRQHSETLYAGKKIENLSQEKLNKIINDQKYCPYCKAEIILSNISVDSFKICMNCFNLFHTEHYEQQLSTGSGKCPICRL